MNVMPTVPAAQYLRMSNEHQRYSLENQAAIIEEYARRKGFSIVQTYTDSGRSGLRLRNRPALVELLEDTLKKRAAFKAVLIYDVSRWGRFQDCDEAAHYEFLCKTSGVEVHYCAECFENNNSISNSVMKALKRTMAAEYSRELGEKRLRDARKLQNLGSNREVNPASACAG
jgi:DNA invertase Pin-like site-specific DNA recombinase